MTLSIPDELAASVDVESPGGGAVITVCTVSNVVPGHGLKVDVPGRGPLAVFIHDGQIYVVDDTCTHGAASLSEGEVFGDEVECPFHKGAFNFRTGAPTARPCTVALKTYAAQIVDGNVCVSLDMAP